MGILIFLVLVTFLLNNAIVKSANNIVKSAKEVKKMEVRMPL